MLTNLKLVFHIKTKMQEISIKLVSLEIPTVPEDGITRDPFDHLLVAQAALEGWRLASHDSTVAKHPIQILW